MFKNLLLVVLISTFCACPAIAMSRWFSATYNDLKFTLYRYGYCYSGLQPVSGPNQNSTQYLANQMKTFLDQGNYDNEQLANVSALMDNICKMHGDAQYAVSLHINVTSFEGEGVGKENRCNAIEQSMNAMYSAFRRAALNRSEPLDFSNIHFYPNATNRNVSYSLTDLINVSWIKSMTDLERVCTITNSVKEYVVLRTSNSTAQARAEPSSGPTSRLVELVNWLLDPILGLQERLYWEGSNRLGQIQWGISSGVGSIRRELGSGLARTRHRLFGSRTKVASGEHQANLTNPLNSTNQLKPVSQVDRSALNVTTPVPPGSTVSAVSTDSTASKVNATSTS